MLDVRVAPPRKKNNNQPEYATLNRSNQKEHQRLSSILFHRANPQRRSSNNSSGFPSFFSTCGKDQQQLVQVLVCRFNLFGANYHSAGLLSKESLLFDRTETFSSKLWSVELLCWKVEQHTILTLYLLQRAIRVDGSGNKPFVIWSAVSIRTKGRPKTRQGSQPTFRPGLMERKRTKHPCTSQSVSSAPDE